MEERFARMRDEPGEIRCARSWLKFHRLKDDEMKSRR